MDKVDEILKEIKVHILQLLKDKKTGKVNLTINLSQGGIASAEKQISEKINIKK